MLYSDFLAAVMIANGLNLDPEDDWFYIAERLNDSYTRIAVFDEENEFVGYLGEG